MEFDPNGIFDREPAHARKMLEQIAADANFKSPQNWRAPVMAVLDAIFQADPPRGGIRRGRVARRLVPKPCACGCGLMVRPQMRRGPAPKYIDGTHAKRAQRKAQRTATIVKKAHGVFAEAFPVKKMGVMEELARE